MSSLRKAALLLTTLVLVGCPYDSPTPLGPASEGRIDPRMLGTWRCTDEEGGEPSLVSFRQFDETQYYVVVDPDTDGDAPATFRVYSSLVRDAPFLSVQELRDHTSPSQRGFVFLRYSFPNAEALDFDELSFDLVTAVQDSEPEAFNPFLDCVRKRGGE